MVNLSIVIVRQFIGELRLKMNVKKFENLSFLSRFIPIQKTVENCKQNDALAL